MLGCGITADKACSWQRMGPLRVPHFQAAAGMLSADAGKLADSLTAYQLLDSAGAARSIHDLDPPLNTDHNRWLEYASPQIPLHQQRLALA